MRITKLSLTNFRSFKETQTIEFAPVTLLFGPNSVGKSTVLMALFYLQQILEKGQCNPQRLEALGNKYIGGFKNLVNGRDISKSIIIKVEYDKLGAIGSTYSQTVAMLNDFEQGEFAPFLLEDQATSTENVALEFTISWSKPNRAAYIERYSVWINGAYLGSTTCDDGMKNPILSDLNLFHPILLSSNHDEWLEDFHENGAEPLSSEWAAYFNKNERGYGHDFDDKFSDDGIVSQLDLELGSMRKFGLKALNGALPILGKTLDTALSHDSTATTAIINEVLSEVFVSPLDNLLSILLESLCIGPLRTITDPTYEPNPIQEQKDWYTGLAAIDILPLLPEAKLKLLHDWLSNPNKLDLGVGIAVEHIRDVREAHQINHKTEFASITDTVEKHIKDISDCLEVIFEWKARKNESDEDVRNRKLIELNNAVAGFMEINARDKHLTDYSKLRVTLFDIVEQCPTSLSDLGVGVSQLLPLVIAALTKNKGLIACEQPELHVHPRVQVAIGDLLTQNNRNTTFLIETHSEHLILRLLRRIRETNDEELPKDISPVHPEDISIVYLEPTKEGVEARRLEIDREGEFVDRWPNGFFAERAEELF